MAEFRGTDFFHLDALYDPTDLQIRDAVRDFVSKEVVPIIGDHADKATFPMHLIPKMAEMGLLGASIKGYGCAGISPTAYGLALQELERGDAGIRSFASVQGSLVMYPILAYGSEEQKDRYLPKMATGEIIGCFGLTEPDHGSDPGGLVTRAEPEGDGWILNGAKMWITNGTLAHVAIVWAQVREGDKDRIRGFLVPTDTDGFSAPEMKGKFSLRASVTSELILQDVKVGPEALLAGVSGLRGPLGCLTQARYGIAWGAIGSAMACYEEAREYVMERTQFGVVLASRQLIQNKLAWMLTEITTMQLMAKRLAELKEKGEAEFYHVSMAKMYNVSKALDIARKARDMLGANGISYEYQVGRHMTNLETVNTYEGTQDIQSLILGRQITGIQAFN